MSESDPRVRYTTSFESTAGVSSELLTWEVGCIMIALTLSLSAIVLIALCCHDRKKRKISGEEDESETSIYTDTEKGTHLEIGVAPYNMTKTPIVPEQSIPDKSNKVAKKKKTERNSVETVDGALYLQRNAGVYNKGRHFEPLPPLPTSVFLISLPTPTDYNSIHPITERYI